MSWLRLIGLSCSRTQEAEDEPLLLVNGREIWDGDMRTGDTLTLDLTVEFRTEARIDLWERDRGHSDAIGSHTVDRSVRGRGPQDVILSRDRGIVGSATYRLRYQVE